MSKRKKEEIIQPIDASLDELVDAVLFSKRKIVANPISPVVRKENLKEEFGVDVDSYVLDAGELHEEWYRLYNIKDCARKIEQLEVNHIYIPLGNSEGNSEQVRILRERGYDDEKIRQFLSIIGVKTLNQHLGQLLAIARISKTREEYEGHFRELFGSEGEG